MPNEKGKRKEKQTEINLDGQVRKFFLLPTPKLTKYMYGMSDRDFQLGDCRDEQAWMLQLEYTNGLDDPTDLQLATIHLRPQVSKREAQKAINCAFRAFPKKLKGQRPSLRHQEKELLENIFDICLPVLNKRGYRKIVQDLSFHIMTRLGLPRSRSTIARELIQYLKHRNLPVKKYVTAKSPISR